MVERLQIRFLGIYIYMYMLVPMIYTVAHMKPKTVLWKAGVVAEVCYAAGSKVTIELKLYRDLEFGVWVCSEHQK